MLPCLCGKEMLGLLCLNPRRGIVFGWHWVMPEGSGTPQGMSFGMLVLKPLPRS